MAPSVVGTRAFVLEFRPDMGRRAMNRRVFLKLLGACTVTAPYAAHGQKDTPNSADSIAHAGGFPPLLVVNDTADGRVATLTVTVAG